MFKIEFSAQPFSRTRTNYIRSTFTTCSYLHCRGLKLSSDRSEFTRISSRFAPLVGSSRVRFPTTEHGSDPFSRLPMHHPPGTIISGPRNSKSESILSSTGSSWWNFLANGALLSTIFDMSSNVR
ncbi:hypothetical protein Hanom_Chr06g00558211 [Helianthus anomalus]